MKKTQKLYRLIALLFIGVFTSTLFLANFNFGTASAITEDDIKFGTNFSTLSMVEKSRVWIMGRAISECIDRQGMETQNKNNGDINDGYWLQDDEDVGEWAADQTEDSDDSEADCPDLAKKMHELMGASGVDALCGMNALAGSDEAIWKRDNGDCASGTGDLDLDEGDVNENDSEIWNRYFRKYLGSDVEAALSNGMRYLIYRENFYQECSKDHGAGWNTPREWKEGSDKEGGRVFKIKWNLNRTTGDPSGADKFWYVVSSEGEQDREVHIDGYGMLFNDDTATCKQLADRINDHADNYLEELGKSDDAGNENGESGKGEIEDSCWSNSGPLAWLLCSVLDVIDGAISLIDSWVNNLLYIDADQYDSLGVNKGNAIMRNLALLLLVPVMMFMVIGTALNFGPFDPYTVKKALPRMFIATIFIVLSLPITQFAVEVSNTVGQGAGNLLLSAAGVDSGYDLGAILAQSGANDSFGGLLLAGGAAASSIVSIGVLLSFASVALVGLLIAFIILVMRQVLLTLLIVLAPLAIIVWIFPGNDKLWGVWKGTFIAMLMMYPLISLLIASGKFVSSLIGGS